MAENTGENAKRNIKEINEIVSAIDSGFRSITNKLEDVADVISNTNNEARVFDNIVKDVGRSINRLSKQNETLIDNQIKLNQGLLTSKKVRQQINDIESTRNILESRLNTLKNQQLDGLILEEAQLEEITKLEKELNQQSQDVTIQYQNQLKEIQKIETKLGIFSRLTKGLTKIPLLGDLLDAEGALAAMNKSALEGKSLFKNLGAGISAAFSGIEKASVILAVVNAIRKVLVFIKDAMFAADERITNIAKNLGLSKQESEGIYKNLTFLKGTLDTSLGSTKNIVDAFNELSRLTEFNSIAQQDQIDTQIILTKEIGLSTEAALGFQETLAVSNIEGNKGLDIVYNQIAAFANQNKILANGSILIEKISKTSKLIQLNFKGNLDLLTKTTLQASKLGLSLDQVNKIGESLLDFEQSISSELEAELLTGRQINLEQARLFALNNDIAGLTEEIAKQGINAAEFASMNRIQQEAIAKALGMQASELGDSLYKQELINKTGGSYLKDLRNQAKLLREQQNIKEAINIENRIAAIEQGILTGKSIQEAERSLSAQTQFNNALERAQEIFSDLVTGGSLDKLANYIERIIFSLESGKSLFSTIAFGPSELPSGYRGMSPEDKAKLIADKKIDNALSMVSYNERQQIKEDKLITASGGPKFAEGGIVTKPITNATVGEAGPEAIMPLSILTNEFREMKSLLSQLVNKEGVVYLDSTKVGTAVASGTYKTK